MTVDKARCRRISNYSNAAGAKVTPVPLPRLHPGGHVPWCL